MAGGVAPFEPPASLEQRNCRNDATDKNHNRLRKPAMSVPIRTWPHAIVTPPAALQANK